MATWPSSLPCYPINGSFQERRQTNVALFQPDIGDSKARRRSTAVGTISTMQFKMTKLQAEAFLTWFENDLKDGSLPFEMRHPRNDTVYDWRFEEPPQITQQTRNMQMVTMQLRRMVA